MSPSKNSTPADAVDKPSYACPGCSAMLYSPYHTICPVCAQPIDAEQIQTALGKEVDTGGKSQQSRQILWLVVGIAVVVIASIATMLATG